MGCGKATFLIALLARWTGATAEGFDRNPWFMAEGRAAAVAADVAGADISRRLSLVETDVPGALIADRAVAMTVAMGATGAFAGDQARSIVGLAAATRAGGSVLFGDALWLREPSVAGLRAFGMARDELADGLDGFIALGVEAGLEVTEVVVVSEADWDAYESAYAEAVVSWAAAHPDDPERDPFLQRVALMADSYRDWRRDAFGFAIARFRVPVG